MNCKTHPTVAALDRCAGCAEPFCQNCLVDIRGQHYCGSCKVMAIDGPPEVDGRTPCKEAGEALTFAIIGLFCCGIIFSPMALSKANKAKEAMREDPTLIGHGKANVAMMLGIAGLVLWLIGLVSRAMHKVNL